MHGMATHGFRFTPAYAGNTEPHGGRNAGRQVHPRIRGEYRLPAVYGMDFGGSPPHTRGIPYPCFPLPVPHGFTPAYAGNTNSAWPMTPPGAVHPRIRGEYLIFSLEMSRVQGSPPHTRGILPYCAAGVIALRFTPAYAGNTAVLALGVKACGVHPRIRGEY